MFGLGSLLFGDETRAHRQETGGGRGAAGRAVTPELASGLQAGTLVATAMGWRPVEAIARGDLVLTFDRGMQKVTRITKAIAWSEAVSEAVSEARQIPRAAWPLHVPAGALGNAAPMTLLPDQAVMLESDTAEVLYGDPFALVTGADLDGFRGIARVPPRGAVEAVMLHFEQDEVVFAGEGALAHCAADRMMSIEALLAGDMREGYRCLDAGEAAFLIECLEDEDSVDGGGWTAAHGTEAYAAAFA
ncbi:Hint domain-containing protein [Psychromarinibacter sp. C21-152]|uniref:Hint domain-containing protein n=1 Tax=Psychromarinibacter sediminicola TaxID=3033385 RepID=A0AAE3NTN6_9RHOB|nr:Hint domain-containing protein [Psychromarinibacter sediminicola]MDF0600362.1 Hint domain-containing protein [Psychromarinibacter sediminicola]